MAQVSMSAVLAAVARWNDMDKVSSGFGRAGIERHGSLERAIKESIDTVGSMRMMGLGQFVRGLPAAEQIKWENAAHFRIYYKQPAKAKFLFFEDHFTPEAADRAAERLKRRGYEVRREENAGAGEGIKFVLGIRGSGRARKSRTQSVLFDKQLWTVDRAKAWLRKHGYNAGTVDEGGEHAGYHRFRQLSPKLFSEFAVIEPGHKPRSGAAMNKEETGFERCERQVVAKGSARSPSRVCATAGRRKYGAKRFQEMAAAGRRQNPVHVATLHQGNDQADVFQTGARAFESIVKHGTQTMREGFESLRGAMSWARLKLFELAGRNPAGRDRWGDITGKTIIVRRNPIDEAQRLFEEFHGYPSEEVLEYVEEEHRHSVLAGIGTLTSLQITNIHGKYSTELLAPDPEEAEPEDVIQVAVSEDGLQLYLVGGDQQIDLETLGGKYGIADADVRDKMLLGTVTRLTYRTRKSFELKGKKQIDFWHNLGEDHAEGVCPVLEYRPRNPSMEIVGGRYRIAPPAKELGGVSPGIVG